MKSFKDFKISLPLEIEVPEIVEESQEFDILEASDTHYVMEAEGKQIHSQPHDPPPVLIMRRKSIRQFPNGQRVALYYVDKINKYVTVPYTDLQWASGVTESYDDVLTRLSHIVEHESPLTVTFENGESMFVNLASAKNIVEAFNSLNLENKQKFSDMVNHSKDDFIKVMNFACNN